MLFVHSVLKQRGSSPSVSAASQHRRKNRSARSQSAPVRSTRKNSCSSPILRTGKPTPFSSVLSPFDRSFAARVARVEPSTSGASASISNRFLFRRLAGVSCDANHELAFAPASGEHRLGSAGPVIELEVQVEGCVDECQVAERLREVAQLLAGEPDLLGVETEVVGVRAHLLKS